MMRRDAKPDGDRGSAVIEFALVLPLLLGFLLGIVTIGISYNRYISMNNAVRESARYGAVSAVDGDLSAWLSTVADVSIAAATGDMDSTVAGQVVCVAYVYPDGTDPEDRTTRLVEQSGSRVEDTGTPCFTDGRPSSERRVQVQLERQSDLEALIYERTVTLSAESVARFERTPQ